MFNADVLTFREFMMQESLPLATIQQADQAPTGAMLLLAFPALKRDPGPVTDRLHAAGADPATLGTWCDLVAQDIRPVAEDEEL